MTLTARQLQVALLVHRGLANKHIAADLHLTEGTVKQYLCKIYKKINLYGDNPRAGLVRYVSEHLRL